MATSIGLTGMKENNTLFKGLFKDLDELGSKGDFRYEQDDGAMAF